MKMQSFGLFPHFLSFLFSSYLIVKASPFSVRLPASVSHSRFLVVLSVRRELNPNTGLGRGNAPHKALALLP